MKPNTNTTDRIIRALIGIIFITLFLTKLVVGTIGASLLGFGGILIMTAIIGFCPLYVFFGIDTCKRK